MDEQFPPEDEAGDAEPSGRDDGWKSYRKVKREYEEYKRQAEEQVTAAREQGKREAMRLSQASSIFGELGYPKIADLYVEKHPDGDVTRDGATGFLAELGLQNPTAEPVAPEVKEAATGFQGNLTPPVAPAMTSFTPEEVRRIGLKDPAEALRIIDSGQMTTPD